MTAQFNIAMVFKADTGGAKAGLAEVATSLKAVSTEATKTGAATAKEAAELERLAVVAAKAARAQADLVAAERKAQATRGQPLIAPLANPQASAAPAVALWRASDTAASSLRDTIAGLNVTTGQQAHEFLETARASAQWRAAMDDVRASFNPLFAASRQYEAQLERIAEAERLGAISAREAAAARAQAASIITPAAGGGGLAGAGVSSMHTGNVAAQGFDIGVTAAMGMNPMMIGLQQGTQLVQVMQQLGGGKTALAGIAQGFLSILNPMSLATIGVVAFGAAGIQWLMSLRKETKSFEESMSDLSDAVDSYAKNISRSRASAADMARDFGTAAEEVRGLLKEMAELDRRRAQRSATEALNGLKADRGLWLPDLAWRDEAPDRSSNAERYEVRRARDEKRLRSFFDLDRSREADGLITSVLDAMTRADSAKTDADQIAALTELTAAWTAASEARNGFSAGEDDFLGQLQKALEDLHKLGGAGGNAAGVEAAKSITRDLSQQVDLERARLKFGEDSAEARAVANRQEREALELKLAGQGLDRQHEDWQNAMLALGDLQFRREEAALKVRHEWFADQDDRIAAIRRETGLIGASASEQARVNALAEAEGEIRKRNLNPLEAMLAKIKALAVASAETNLAREQALKDLRDAQTADMFDAAITATRDPYLRAGLEAQREYARQIADDVDADIAAGHATRVRARALRELGAAQADYLRTQDEQLAKLRLELVLVGQTAEVRARVLALSQAEQDIQRLGLEGELADQARRKALVQAELAQTIEAQADAWKRVQSAGEAAIDGVLDKLRKGDVRGAIDEMLGEIEKGFFDLAIRNPLKNAILGTNLGTFEDVGGWGGIIGRFTGKAPVDEGALARQSVLPLQSMTVTAASVILQGNLSGIGAGIANLNAAPMGIAGALPGSGDVQSQIWNFFSAKGLAPHQVAGIMGNVAGESGFNPRAVGDNGTSFGLFQHHAGRGQGLLGAVGGMGGLENVQAQLEFVWGELLTTERAALERLQNAPTVGASADAWMRGFERPSDEAMAQSWGKRLAAAEQAAAQFGNAVQAAGAQVGQGGSQAAAGLAQAGQGAMVASQGMGAFGQLLSGIGGMVGGKTGSVLQTVVGIGGQILGGAKLFREGGFTGGSDPDRAAGIVHEGEFVFDAAATRRIGVQNLEGIRKGAARGFKSGGYVGPGPGARAANSAAVPGMGADNVRRLELNANISGTGNAEIRDGVMLMISQAFDTFRRDMLPAEVKSIVADRWSS